MVMGLRPIVVVLAGALVLGGCAGVKNDLGLGKDAPDEFTIVTKAPLIMPPDFSLRPPTPGQKRLRDIKPRDAAKIAIFGKQAADPTKSPGENEILAAANAQSVDPAIRQVIDQETASLIEKNNTLADQIMFWRDPVDPSEVLIDARKEDQRIKQNTATASAVTEGETPTVEQPKKAPLEGLFDFSNIFN